MKKIILYILLLVIGAAVHAFLNVVLHPVQPTTNKPYTHIEAGEYELSFLYHPDYEIRTNEGNDSSSFSENVFTVDLRGSESGSDISVSVTKKPTYEDAIDYLLAHESVISQEGIVVDDIEGQLFRIQSTMGDSFSQLILFEENGYTIRIISLSTNEEDDAVIEFARSLRFE